MNDDARGISEPPLDRYARMVQRYLGVPVALVSLVEPHQQVLAGRAGLPDAVAEAGRHVVRTGAPLSVADARADPRLCDDAVGDATGLVAYAGWPLLDEDGAAVGSLCAVDTTPRHWTGDDLDTLADLATACSAELVQRRRQQRAEDEAEHARLMSQRSTVLLALSEALSMTRTLDDIAHAVERVALESLGCLHAGIWLTAPTEAGGADRLRHVSDPEAAWASAVRNAVLPLDDSNPLGESLTRGSTLHFAGKAEQNARYPDLDVSEQVGDARAFVPLSLERVFGTLALVWDGPHEVVVEERITIATLASYVAQAVQRALLLEEREQSSLTLQTAMLTRLPTARGLEIAARYRPAGTLDRVGGDWYDAVVTPDGETNLMIGDVMGHDIAAAAVMGELRSMLRMLSWAHLDTPAGHLSRLDDAMLDFGVERFASLVYARVPAADGSGRRIVRWSNAGHLPPLLVHADGRCDVLDDTRPGDLLLGIEPTSIRHNQTAVVPEGSILLLYTDGLVERRGESVDVGIERARKVLTTQMCARPGLTPDALLDRLLRELVGKGHEDDIAMLAVRVGA